jgi:hypothetical protein
MEWRCGLNWSEDLGFINLAPPVGARNLSQVCARTGDNAKAQPLTEKGTEYRESQHFGFSCIGYNIRNIFDKVNPILYISTRI